jgi:hypothetical protein
MQSAYRQILEDDLDFAGRSEAREAYDTASTSGAKIVNINEAGRPLFTKPTDTGKSPSSDSAENRSQNPSIAYPNTAMAQSPVSEQAQTAKKIISIGSGQAGKATTYTRAASTDDDIIIKRTVVTARAKTARSYNKLVARGSNRAQASDGKRATKSAEVAEGDQSDPEVRAEARRIVLQQWIASVAHLVTILATFLAFMFLVALNTNNLSINAEDGDNPGALNAYTKGLNDRLIAAADINFEPTDVFTALNFKESSGIITIGDGMAEVVGQESLAALQNAINNAEQSGANVGFVMLDINTGMGVAYNADYPFYGASSIKGIFVTSAIANNPNSFSRYKNLYQSALIYSDNDSYETLYNNIGTSYIEQWYKDANTTIIDPNPVYPHYSARDLTRLWALNYDFLSSDAPHASELAEFLSNPQTSAIRSTLGWQYTTLSKAGWFSDGKAKASNSNGESLSQATRDLALDDFSSTVDAGVVLADDRPYLITVMSNSPSDFSVITPLVESLGFVHDKLAESDYDDIALVRNHMTGNR